jgi:hypothetical protein
MFVPVARTRSLRDWFAPLDGCPRCGYAYDREDGYFLMATWGVHYFTIAGFGWCSDSCSCPARHSDSRGVSC